MTKDTLDRTAAAYPAPGPDLRSIPGLTHALRPAVMRLSRRLRQMRDGSDELTSSQLSALSVLLSRGDHLMGELAAAEKVAAPSMTRIVNGLQERGLVERLPDPTDRRQCRVSLTGTGRQILLADRKRTRRVAGRTSGGAEQGRT